MQQAEILIDAPVTSEQKDSYNTLLVEALHPTNILYGPPDREPIDGYVFQGMYDKTAWRFAYDEEQYSEALDRFLFKLKLAHNNVTFKTFGDPF